MFKNKKFRVFSRQYSQCLEPLSSYDVIIIGGGHNGLVAAGYLAKNRIKTCVLERRPITGGAAVTEEIIPNFKFSRASYVLSLLRPQIYSDLKLKKYGLEYFVRNPSSYTPLKKAYWTSKATSLTLGSNSKFNYDQISLFSENDAKRFVAYEKNLQKIVDIVQPLMDISPHTLKQLCEDNTSIWTKLKMILKSQDLKRVMRSIIELKSSIPFAYEIMFTPAVDIMNRWFETDTLKATLLTDACIGNSMNPATIGSSYVLIHLLMGGIEQHKGAWVYPKGGMGAVSDAMAKCALDHGAHIFTNKSVTEIKMDDMNRITGVLTADNKYIKSSIVLSNATPKITFLDLLPAEVLPAKFKNSIENINYKSPVTKINVALKNLPNFEANPNADTNTLMPHHQCTIHLNCENVDQILEAFSVGTSGLLPERPMIELTIPSSLDYTLCPKNNHVCLIFTQYTMYELRDRKTWDEETKLNYANKVFDCIEEYAPGFKESIIGYEILPPPDLEQIFSLTGGHIYHGELSLNQLLFNRPTNWNQLSPYTPIKGLYLCGSGAHPGGGVTGSPGRLAALSVISDIKNY